MSEKNKILEDLKLNYTLPGHIIAFSGINTIYKYYNKRISKKDIEDFLSTKYGYTRHKETTKRYQNPTYKYFKRYQWQADLIEISNVAEENKNYKFILSVIDIYTRYAWLRLLKTKKALEVCTQFEDILSTVNEKPLTLYTDKGGELKNRLLEKLCLDNKIKLFHSETSYHAPFIERFQRSIQRIISQYCTENATYQFYDKLQLLLHTYNSRPHRMLGGLSPKEVEADPNNAHVASENEKYLSKFKKKRPKYKKGTLVRIKSEKVTFHKGYRPTFKTEIFKIVQVKDNLPVPLYTLGSLDDQEILIGNFYQFQLTPVKQTQHRIQQVLKRDKKNQRSFVRWEGYPERFNSWVEDSSISKIN